MLYLIVGAIAAYAVYQSFFADDRDDRPPSRSQSRESPSARVRRREERHQRQTIDSSWTEHTPLEDHVSLRDKAKREGELMAQCYRQSQEAYIRRDRARAKALSDEGKRHALEKENLNAKASAAVFKENNQNKAPGEVDLHGLYVKEAIAYSEKAISEGRRRGDSEVHLIVGQGTHSDGGVSRLKPAIQADMLKRGVHVEVHPKNPGVLVVQLGSK